MKEALSNGKGENLQSLIEEYSIRESVTGLLKEYLEKIDDCLGNLENIRLKLVLHEIVGKTFRDHI
jgi:hypothetical protein